MFIELHSQSELEAFVAQWPNCKNINNSFTIGYRFGDELSDINDLSPLENIRSVEGFFIRNNPRLKSFDGLHSFTHTGNSLSILNNDSLTNLAGLDTFSYASNNITIEDNDLLINLERGTNNPLGALSFTIRNNASLKNLEGLNLLNNYDGDIRIEHNPNFESLEELSGLTSIGNFSIIGSDKITDLSGLESLQSAFSFVVGSNPMLQSLAAINSLTTVQQVFSIGNNDQLTTLTELNPALGAFAILISGNDNLTNLNGLYPTSVFNLTINNNSRLKNLDGLASLQSAASLRIINNDSLLNLEGLDQFQNASFPFTDPNAGITIENNPMLNSLKGLDNLVEAQNLYIRNNPVLSSLGALNHPVLITENMEITGDSILSVCGVQAVCDYIENIDFPVLGGNADGCNEVAQIACTENDLGLSGTVFYDFNENKLKDTFEFGLTNQLVTIRPPNLNLLTTFDGNFFLNATVDTAYIIDWVDDPDWMLTTDSAQYALTFQKGMAENGANIFGLKPNFSKHEFQSNIASQTTRCDTEISYYYRFQNTGTFLENGTVEFQYDPLITYIDALPEPDFIDVNNHILRYNFTDFYPFQYQDIELTFLMPDASSISEIIDLKGTIFREENGVVVMDTETNYETELLCAYDPNDKQVLPRGEGDANYTLKDEKLTYTLRFQNTGNIDAINVEIRDTLDANLDWSTFRVLNYSHEVFTTRTNDGTVSFWFPNIYLPAASVDSLGSQGFVTYEIEPLPGLADFTVVENTGHIYFDSNPPIVTNTTINTYVDMIPTSVNDLEKSTISVYPNPASSNLQVTISDHQSINQIFLFNQLGQKVLETKNNMIDVTNFSAGIYFLEVWVGNQREIKKIMVL